MFKTITKAVVLTAVAGGLNLAVVAPAQAQVSVAEGRKCGFASVTDPTIEGGEVQTGQINGGPLVATAPGATISMTCTIQVGSANAAHNGADSCAVSSAAMLQAAAVPPTLCSYASPEGQPVYMCTQVTINGVTFYWHVVIDPTTGQASGSWSLNSGSNCAEAISQELFPGPLGPVLDLIDQIVIDHVDPALCQVLASLAGTYGPILIKPDGDVYIDDDGTVPPTWEHPDEFWWDCPPYV